MLDRRARESQSEWFRSRRHKNGRIDNFWLGGPHVPWPSECGVLYAGWGVTTLPIS